MLEGFVHVTRQECQLGIQRRLEQVEDEAARLTCMAEVCYAAVLICSTPHLLAVTVVFGQRALLYFHLEAHRAPGAVACHPDPSMTAFCAQSLHSCLFVNLRFVLQLVMYLQAPLAPWAERFWRTLMPAATRRANDSTTEQIFAAQAVLEGLHPDVAAALCTEHPVVQHLRTFHKGEAHHKCYSLENALQQLPTCTHAAVCKAVAASNDMLLHVSAFDCWTMQRIVTAMHSQGMIGRIALVAWLHEGNETYEGRFDRADCIQRTAQHLQDPSCVLKQLVIDRTVRRRECWDAIHSIVQTHAATLQCVQWHHGLQWLERHRPNQYGPEECVQALSRTAALQQLHLGFLSQHQIDKVLSSPGLSSLTQLRLDGCVQPTSNVQLLPKLQSLQLEYGRIASGASAEHIAAMYAQPDDASALRRLVVIKHDLKHHMGAWRALLPLLPSALRLHCLRLQDLYPDDPEVLDPALNRLAAALQKQTELRELELDQSTFVAFDGDDAVESSFLDDSEPTLLPAVCASPRLERLSVCGFPDAYGAAASSWPACLSKLTQLSELCLRRNDIDCVQVMGLVEALPALLQLQVLNVASNRIRCRGLQSVVEALAGCSRLHTLQAARNPIGDRGVCELACGLRKLTALTQLELQLCKISRVGEAVLAPLKWQLPRMQVCELWQVCSVNGK